MVSDSFHPIPPTPNQLPGLIWKLVQPLLDRYKVTFERAFSPSAARAPVIVCSLVSRTPGGRTGEVYKPRLRASTVSSDGRYIVEYWGRGFTCTYRFDVVCRVPAEADAVMDALEEALETITPDLQSIGVQEWYFLEQSGPHLIESRGEQLYAHTVTYQAIMDRVMRRTLPMISAVETKVGVVERIEADIPVHRGDGNRDLIRRPDGSPKRNIVRVVYASDETALWEKYGGKDGTDIPLEARIYVPGVDFIPEFEDGLQSTVLIWTDIGRRPAPGSVYYVTVSVLNT